MGLAPRTKSATPHWELLRNALEAALEGSGLDIVVACTSSGYDALVDARHRLPSVDCPDALVLLVANTQALWSPFLAAFREESALRKEADPLDSYVAKVVTKALERMELLRGRRVARRWSHQEAPQRIAMQTLAKHAGLGHMGPCGLLIHPTYGPWLALRAAIVIDVPGPLVTNPPDVNPCQDCDQPCMTALKAALAQPLTVCGDDDSSVAVEESWPSWLAVRDACPVGRRSRYGAAQIAYHYTKRRSILDALREGESSRR